MYVRSYGSTVGTCTLYGSTWYMYARYDTSTDRYGYFSQGHATPYIEGVTLRPWRDDRSEEWQRMWERVQVEPVRERYKWKPLSSGDERHDRPSNASPHGSKL